MARQSRGTAIVGRIAMTVLAIMSGIYAVSTPVAEAIPAFTSKHALVCAACDTAPPRLNPCGERSLENDYQLPSTEDGSTTGKKSFGNLNVDNLANCTECRLRGNALNTHTIKQQIQPTAQTQLPQLEKHIIGGGVQAIKTISHTLKSSPAQLGGHRLAGPYANDETAGHFGKTDELSA